MGKSGGGYRDRRDGGHGNGFAPRGNFAPRGEFGQRNDFAPRGDAPRGEFAPRGDFAPRGEFAPRGDNRGGPKFGKPAGKSFGDKSFGGGKDLWRQARRWQVVR